MADKKHPQSFRFRLPWRTRGSAVEPDPRPVAKTQNLAQTTTSILVEQPPFRAAGKATVKASPSQAQAPSRNEPPPPSPSRSPTESQNSTSGTTQTRVEVESSPSSPSSPSRPATESQNSSSRTTQTRVEVESSPPSPSHAATESRKASSATAQTRVESFRSSPSPIASQPQAASQESPKAHSQPHTQENSQLPSFSAESPSRATQPEPKEPYAALSTSETIFKAQNNTPTTVQTHAASAEAVETVASPKKVDPDTIGGDQKPHPESETESKEHKEREKVLLVIKEEKANDPDYKELMQETATQLHAAVTGFGKHTKDLLEVASQAEQRHSKEEAFDRKETLASSSSSSKLTKAPEDTSTPRISIQKMVSSTVKQAPLHREIRENALKLNKLAIEDQMHEKPVSIVTVAGENRGASMHISSEPEKGGEFMPIHRSYKTNPDDSLEATTDGEVSSEGEKFDQTSKEDRHMIAYINNNVQSINNAIVLNTSVAERNPGVQTVFSHNPAESIKPNGKSDPLKTHKAQITKTPSEKLTHESTVRRRCLRGLFMEPSDSDPDNPEKPRRHGCRYSCGMNREDTNTGIL
ncbi:uncharacterized protein LOC126633559 [Malus sylvestris]|uniref:uncharacterized protein LOC126633559 n=1 Tax=Malus sylvestris TaxID=3752 RepID=UPI0021ACC46E|nr:uncharacterized protein LOC126633559 [Malus sylvestris]